MVPQPGMTRSGAQTVSLTLFTLCVDTRVRQHSLGCCKLLIFMEFPLWPFPGTEHCMALGSTSCVASGQPAGEHD